MPPPLRAIPVTRQTIIPRDIPPGRGSSGLVAESLENDLGATVEAKRQLATSTYVPGAGTTPPDGEGITTVQEEGSSLPEQAIINFLGPWLTAADDPGNSRTNVSVNYKSADGTNGITVTVTIGSTTMIFKNGLLVGGGTSGIPFVDAPEGGV